jgi:hypothetical protein
MVKTRRRREGRRRTRRQRGGVINIYSIPIEHIHTIIMQKYNELVTIRNTCIDRCVTTVRKSRGKQISKNITNMYQRRPTSETASLCNGILARGPDKRNDMCMIAPNSGDCICRKYSVLFNDFNHIVNKLVEFDRMPIDDIDKPLKYFIRNIVESGKNLVKSLEHRADVIDFNIETLLEQVDVSYYSKTIQDIINMLPKNNNSRSGSNALSDPIALSSNTHSRRGSNAPSDPNFINSNPRTSFARKVITNRNSANRIAFASTLSL